MHSVGDLFLCLHDFNRHVGRNIDGFDGVHGGYGLHQRNMEVRVSLVLSGEGIVCQICGLSERKRGR